jgi:hypothetical protein
MPWLARFCVVRITLREKGLRVRTSDLGELSPEHDPDRSRTRWSESGVRPPFSIAYVLNCHPDRHALIKQKPDMTKREASKLMRELRGNVDDDPTPEFQDSDFAGSGGYGNMPFVAAYAQALFISTIQSSPLFLQTILRSSHHLRTRS